MAINKPVLKLEQTTDRQINQLQRNVIEGIRAISEAPYLFGQSLSFNKTAGTPVLVYHSLGRMPAGFLVLNVDADARLYSTSSTFTTITFNSAGSNANFTVWVF